MYVTAVKGRQKKPAILLRESFRQDGRVQNRTLSNLSHWPAWQIELLRRVLKQERLVRPAEALCIERSLPHGHVAAVLGVAKQLELAELLASRPSRHRTLALGMILMRILCPRSKLATAAMLNAQSSTSTLSEELGVQEVTDKALYESLDWLMAQQKHIEKKLAKRHLKDGTLALYDVTSTYFEGRACALARHGYSRDHRKDRPQIVVGLLCSGEGIPVACEVFEGNAADPSTVSVQVQKLRQRFGIKQVVMVGDRGMLTSARIREELKAEPGVQWVTALNAKAVQALHAEGSLQLELFTEMHLGEISSPDYPGERLIVCRNPLLGEQRGRMRERLLETLEARLQAICEATTRASRPVRGEATIGLRVGKALQRSKVGKLINWRIEGNTLHFARNTEAIAQESQLDGFYLLRTNVAETQMPTDAVVRTYKQLGAVERAFRCLKTVDLKLRPIYHYKAERVKAHVLVCMLAYYVQWHMKQALAPLMFAEEDLEQVRQTRPCPVARAEPSQGAKRKAATQRSDEGLPVLSFQGVLQQLATLTRNRVRFASLPNAPPTNMLASLTPLQHKAFALLQVTP